MAIFRPRVVVNHQGHRRPPWRERGSRDQNSPRPGRGFIANDVARLFVGGRRFQRSIGAAIVKPTCRSKGFRTKIVRAEYPVKCQDPFVARLTRDSQREKDHIYKRGCKRFEYASHFVSPPFAPSI